MVSSSNILLGGLVLVLLGVTATSVFGIRRPSDISQNIMEDPPIQDPQIPFLENLLSQATQLFRQTFPTIKRIPKEQLSRSARFNLGVFAGKGVRTQIDPFTGRKVIIPFGERASGKTRSFFSPTGPGGIFGDPGENLRRVAQGNIIKLQLDDFINNLKDQLKILRTPDIVSV